VQADLYISKMQEAVVLFRHGAQIRIQEVEKDTAFASRMPEVIEFFKSHLLPARFDYEPQGR
jgi:hypothetical protein